VASFISDKRAMLLSGTSLRSRHVGVGRNTREIRVSALSG
jgi:hypothetical protein